MGRGEYARAGIMTGLSRGMGNYIKMKYRLAKAGVTFGSILLSPIRRRFAPARNQIDLVSGITIVSPPDEPLWSLFEEIWIGRCYAGEAFQFPPGAVIIDVGAHVGVFTLWAATRESEVKVIAVEPSPRMCHFLRQNISANRLQNVSVVQSACSGQSGEAILYSRGPEAWNSLYSRDIAGSVFHPTVRTQTLTLDDVFQRFDVQICNLLKLDCEGAEYEILYRARKETLQKVEKISMECHVALNEHTPDELADFLRSQGFDVNPLRMIDEEGGYLYAARRP